MNSIQLTPTQEDTLSEIFNIGIGKAASVLSAMTNVKVHLTVPSIKLVPIKSMAKYLGVEEDEISAINMNFDGCCEGISSIIFPNQSALKLVNLLTDQDENSDDFDEILTETLKEVGNIVINSILGSISNILNNKLNYQLPEYHKSTFDNIFKNKNIIHGIIATTKFKLENKEIDGNIIIFLSLDSSLELLNSIDEQNK